jgi:hypothetical protein
LPNEFKRKGEARGKGEGIMIVRTNKRMGKKPEIKKGRI